MTTPTVIRHVLPGLRPEPLARYLAGLGVIRVLGEQADPAATATWTPEGLVIGTTVPDIAAWLADQYVPTPVLSPWNNGSGFGAKDKEPLRVLDVLRNHPSARLSRFRAAIELGEEVARKGRSEGWISDVAGAGDKSRVVQEFRNRCPEDLLAWIDTTVVLTGNTTYFPPLLGTGGNDGRLDFSTNFHQRLLDVIGTSEQARERSLALARDLLAGAEAEQLASAAIGQFNPGSAGRARVIPVRRGRLAGQPLGLRSARRGSAAVRGQRRPPVPVRRRPGGDAVHSGCVTGRLGERGRSRRITRRGLGAGMDTRLHAGGGPAVVRRGPRVVARSSRPAGGRLLRGNPHPGRGAGHR